MSAANATEIRRFALRAALLYALIGGVWILLSDQLVEWLSNDPKWIVMISVAKGLAFVAASAFAIWLLLRRGGGEQGIAAAGGAAAPRGRLHRLPILVLALAILVLTSAGLFHTLRHQEDRGLSELRAIADLKARQLDDWLRERAQDASLVAGARHLGEAYLRWRRGDAASGERLRHDLREFIRYTGFQSAQLLDARAAEILWDSEARDPDVSRAPVSEMLRAAATRAWVEGKPIPVGPFRDADGHLHLDLVVAQTAEQSGVVIVLHIDLAAELFPLLQTWPASSASGEVVWFRRDGDDALFLNELRLRADTATRLRLPIARGQTLVAKFLRGEVRPGRAVKGTDYRGVAVFGVVAAVPSGAGYVLAKVDEAELYAGARADAAWVLLAGLLALFALGVGVHLARQRRDLAVAESLRQAQAERLRALNLLDSIADGSTDAIFAKDIEGRYLLFNRETARITGKSVAEALNHDDTALFPAAEAAIVRANDQRVIAENQVKTYEETLSTTQGERVFLATKGPLRDADGKVIGLFGISRDISERKDLEAALRHQAEELRGRNEELERFNRASVGRELDMVELKRRMNALAQRSGEPPPYDLAYLAPTDETKHG